MVTSFRDLPEKAVVEIFSWLSPETLGQCKCVKKSWNALIDRLIQSRWFVAKHLKNGSRLSPLLFLTGDWMKNSTHPYLNHYITDNHVVTSYYVCHENDELNFNIRPLSSNTCGLTSSSAEYHTSLCDGIVFIMDNHRNMITLCNPTKREFKHLDPKSSHFFGSDLKTFMSGFGYDAIDDVYKVVRVVSLPKNTSVVRAEVCTLGSCNQGGSWREIRMIDVGNYFMIVAGSGRYHRGFIYWLLYNEVNRTADRTIISFDMHEEEFQVVPLPSGIVDDPMEFNTVDGQDRVTRVWKGAILCFWNQVPTLLKFVVMLNPMKADISKPVEVWKMETDSSSSGRERFSCWVKHATLFPPLQEVFFPLAFWKSDELFLSLQGGGLATYNLTTQNVRPVRLHPQKFFQFLLVFLDVKSLVSVNNYLS